jgi:Domain of unknown function (DUF4332)
MAAVDVIDLAGIGPVLADRLNDLGIFTTSDLLRAERRRLAEAVDGVTVEQLRRWQAVSEFLEVEGLPLAVAEQLYERQVESVDELSSRSLSALRALVDAMRNDGDIAESPSDDELVAWMRDATCLRYTGTLNGTVTGANKSPIAGVAVSCLDQQTETDARGRFRLRRLPLDRALIVRLEHDGHRPKAEASRAVPPGFVSGQQFRLARKLSHTQSERVLSELDGDVLPPREGAPIRARAQTGAPSERDLLRVTELTDDGGARVASRLFDYDNGIFIVRTYRLTSSSLQPGFRLRDHLRAGSGRWEVVEMTAADVEQYRRRLVEQRARTLPDDPTADEVDRAISAWQAARAATRAGGTG